MGTIDNGRHRPSRGAILLSGFVFPGMGQLLQRRWVAGALFLGTFSTLFCLLLIQSFQIIMAFYRVGLSETVPEDDASPLALILGLFGACLVVYVVSVVDTYLALRRQARHASTRRHFSPEIASLLEDVRAGEDKTCRM